jgi:hypothetical protein
MHELGLSGDIYFWSMEILVKLGKWKASNEVRFTAPSPDCSVAEVLAEVRRRLPPAIAKILQLSERSGSLLFLALTADGPGRLSEDARLSDCIQTTDNCTLWLMCTHVNDAR